VAGVGPGEGSEIQLGRDKLGHDIARACGNSWFGVDKVRLFWPSL
jgi:hypothetical protein